MNSMIRLLLATLALAGASPQQGPSNPRQELARDLLAALNSKDRSKVRSFVEERFEKNGASETRVNSLMGLVDQGSPFVLVRFGSESPTTVNALVTDRNQTALAFLITVTQSNPPKIAGLRIEEPEAVNEKPPKDYSGWATLTSLAEALRKETETPAVSLAVIRDGKLEASAVGVRKVGGNDAVRAEDPFAIGSIGKPICSTVVSRLIEMGKLRWDMTLKEALPGVPMKPEFEKVTLEQIMRHRGGLPQGLNFRAAEVQQILGDAKTPPEIRAKYAQHVLSQAPIAPADTRFAYSNAGYALLSRAAELAAGKPYEELVRTLVFEPLGLKHSYVTRDDYPSQMPSGHRSGPEGLLPITQRGPLSLMLVGAGGGIHMSPSDVARFGEAHLKGLKGQDGLLKASTVARLHKGVAEGANTTMVYGSGWGMVRLAGGIMRHGHNGSDGTYQAELAIYPEANLVIVAIVNRGDGGRIAEQARDAIQAKYVGAGR